MSACLMASHATPSNIKNEALFRKAHFIKGNAGSNPVFNATIED